MTTEKRGAVLACMLLIMTVGLSAEASMIGVNFVGGGASLAATDSSGFVSQTNWNNATDYSGTDLALSDESGNATGATITYSSHWIFGLQSYGGALVPADQQMMNGLIMGFYLAPGDWPQSVMAAATISNIPYDNYDAYVYIGADPNPNTVMVTIGATDYYVTQNQYNTGSFAFVEITSTDPNNPTQYGNYIHLSGLTSDTFSVTEQTLPGWPYPGTEGIFGIQIVEVPEPGTLSLLGLGGLGMIIRRRRNK